MAWRLPMPDADLASRTVGELVEFAGMAPADDYSLAEVVALLRRCEYDLDADTLVGLLTRNRIPRPPGDRWDAIHIHVLASYLEGHRLWMPHSELHRRKKSAARLDLEAMLATGCELPGEQHGLLGLLTLTVMGHHRDEREGALELVLHRLRGMGVDLHG